MAALFATRTRLWLIGALIITFALVGVGRRERSVTLLVSVWGPSVELDRKSAVKIALSADERDRFYTGTLGVSGLRDRAILPGGRLGQADLDGPWNEGIKAKVGDALFRRWKEGVARRAEIRGTRGGQARLTDAQIANLDRVVVPASDRRAVRYGTVVIDGVSCPVWTSKGWSVRNLLPEF